MYIGTELADSDEHIRLLLIEYLKEIRKNLLSILEKHPDFQEEHEIVSENLIGLFCGLMTVGYIQTYSERVDQVNLKLDLILK